MRVRSISDTIAYRGADVPERKERIIQQAPEEHDLAGEQLVITIEAEHDHEPPLTKKRPEKRPPPPPEPGGEAPHDARETVVLATMHGGATWNAQRPGTSQILTGVTFSDATHGWAVGQGGTILATTDGGAWRAELGDHCDPLRRRLPRGRPRLGGGLWRPHFRHHERRRVSRRTSWRGVGATRRRLPRRRAPVNRTGGGALSADDSARRTPSEPLAQLAFCLLVRAGSAPICATW